MPSSTEEEQYSLVSDSDESTIAGSEEHLGKSILPLPRHKSKSRAHRTRKQRWQKMLTWLRWTVVVGLQSVIIALLVSRSSSTTNPPNPPAGGDINGLYQETHRIYRPLTFEEELYMPNMTSNENREQTRRQWDKLMPLGSGSVSVPDWTAYPLLGEPITDDPLRSGPLYEASWTHALHCLYYSVDTYHQLVLNGPDGNENHHHASHCFEYLRQNILCNLDMTLEGSYSAHDETGGQMHVCRDRDAAVRWIESRRVDDLQDIIGP